MAEARKIDTVIARIAGRQLGIVTRAQLIEAGLSRHAIRRRLEAGRLAPAGRHVYRVSGAPRSWEAAALAACRELGPLALVSHRTAAAVWKLVDTAPSVTEVTVPYGNKARSSRTPAVRVHRSRSLSDADRTTHRRLPVTTIERTLIDLGSVLEPDDLVRCAHAALCQRLVSPAGLQRALDRLTTGGREGRGVLSQVVQPWLAGLEVDSVAEAQVLRAIAAAGLPMPEAQYEVRAGDFCARLDFAWPDHLLALEVDGFRWHANPAAQVSDASRSNRLAALGWMVLRTTPAEMASAREHVIEAIASQLRMRRSSPPA